MRTRRSHLPGVIALLGIAAASPPRLPAQQAAQPAPPVTPTSAVIRPGIPASGGELTPAVQTRLARGDELTGRRRYAAAQREFRAAAEIARREGHLPSLTLWHLASAYYYEGDLQRAALVLKQLAVEASQHGDLVVEALALFDAAWLNDRSDRRNEAAREVADLRRLLRSPYLPAAVREFLTDRLAPPAAVIAEP